eukprot:s1097_g7.t1
MARTGEFHIPAFPDFGAALTELKQFQRSPQPEYQVCVPTADGALVVKQTLVDFWTLKHTSFADKMQELLKIHDNEFNTRRLKRGAEEVEETAEEEPPTKRLCLGTSLTMEETSLNAGSFVLHLSDKDASLWVGCSTAVTVEVNTELWGFGSGDFAKGSEGADMMSDTSADGRWLLYGLQSAEEYVITLNDLLKNLEDSGEVGVKILEHKLEKDGAGNFKVEPLGGVCFVLDALKPKKKKAKVASALTFGLLQRCELEASESVSADPSEEVDVAKRPATKKASLKKKKEDDSDITALGVCKGNDDDDDNDDDSVGAEGDEDGPKKRPSSRKTKHTGGKKDRKEKKRERKHKKSKTGKRHGSESSLSCETESEGNQCPRVSRECLNLAFENAALAEQRAFGNEAGV